MKTIFVVIHRDSWNGYTSINSAFSTKEKAEAYIKNIVNIAPFSTQSYFINEVLFDSEN